MLDMEQIEATIKELENGTTTFDNCLKLASLYIVQEHLNDANLTAVHHPETGDKDEVLKELNDIFPQYHEYVEAKKLYQLKQAPHELVLDKLGYVCKELEEFVNVLYTSTNSPEERLIMEGTLTKMHF